MRNRLCLVIVALLWAGFAAAAPAAVVEVDGVRYTVSPSGAVTDERGQAANAEVAQRARYTHRVLRERILDSELSRIEYAPVTRAMVEMQSAVKPLTGAYAFVLFSSFDLVQDMTKGALTGTGFAPILETITKEILLETARELMDHPESVSMRLANEAYSLGLTAYRENYRVYREVMSGARVLRYEDAVAYMANDKNKQMMVLATRFIRNIRSQRYSGPGERERAARERALIQLAELESESLAEGVGLAFFAARFKTLYDEALIGLESYEPYRLFRRQVDELNRYFDELERAYRANRVPARAISPEEWARRWALENIEGDGVDRHRVREHVIAVGPGDALVADGLDLIFVIDSTGSMRPSIDQVKRDAVRMIREVREMMPSVRVALVLYRDFDELYLTKSYPFTFDQATAIGYIQAIEVGGGGDHPEAVYTGLMHAIGTKEIGDWRDGVMKLVVLMGDAPPTPRDPYSADDVVKLAYEVDPAHILAVALPGSDRETLESFAELGNRSGGLFLDARAVTDLPSAIVDVVRAGIRKVAIDENIVVVWPGGELTQPFEFPASPAFESPTTPSPPSAAPIPARLDATFWVKRALEATLLLLLILIAVVLSRSRIAWVVVIQEPGVAPRAWTTRKRNIWIGRSFECDVTLNDSTVSAKHVLVYLDESKYRFRDLGSANGVFADEKRLREGARPLGSRIRIGHTQIAINRSGRKRG